MLDWPQPGQARSGQLSGPAGTLETEAAAPEQPVGSAVICHPHPQFGGTKDNKVVYTLARACRAAGLVAVRFNFRGIGASTGEYADGDGETEDALAVAEWVQQNAHGPLVIAGFSFGAAVALRAATTLAPAALITVALPTNYFTQGLPRPDCPWLTIHGDADEVVEPRAALKHLRTLDSPPDIEVLAGAGHFFHGRLTELGEIIGRHLPTWLDASAGQA